MDLEKVRAGLQEIEDEKAAAQAESDKAANRSILDRVEDLGNEFISAIGNYEIQKADSDRQTAEMATEAAEGAVETVKDVADAAWTMEKNAQDVKTRGQQLEMAYTDASIQQSEASGDYQVQENAYKNFQQAGAATEGTVENVLRSPFRQASRSLIENYADRTDDSILGDAAKALQRTDANIEYFMTDEEKLTKARQIEASTGIPADSFLQDNKAYKQALDVYHYRQKIDAAGGNINDVWQEFPELQGVADMDKEGAAIALHNLDAVRSTHGIIDTFTKMLERGNVKLEYDNLQYKIMMGAADDNDRQRAEDLKKQLEEDRLAAPSFLEDPIAAIVGGVAESAPEMWQSTSESLREATAMAVIAAAASAAAGSAATPIGAAVGGTVGAAGGFVYGMGRSFLAQVARRELIAAAAGTGLRLGAFMGMARPEIGSRFAEYKDLKDENGNSLLTENQAAGWAMLGGSLNAGIELANFGIVTRALAGAPHARKVFGDIIEQTGSRMLTREKVLNALKDRTGDVLKITASEAGEEGLQSISDDMVHNGMEWSTGDTSNKIYGPGEILERAGKSTLQAIPGSLGFGLLGATGGTVSSGFRQTAAMRHLAKFEAMYGENARKTYTGTVMLEQLQQTIDKGNLKEKAPDVQRKILREQLKDTEYPNTYIDSEMAMQQEGGLENLKAVAKAAGISNDELQTAIEEKGQILVPTEQFLQAGTSPEFLQNVSFSPEADSMARMQRDAKTIIEDMQKRQQQSIDKQVELINTVLDQYFPLHEKSSAEEQAMRDMAAVAIYSDPANPARGWSAAMKERQDRLQELIGPMLERLRDGMGKGGQLMEVEDEQGNKKTQRFTENDEWYRNFYKTFGRQPTQKELEDMAVAVITGDPSAPKLEGWIPTTEEEHQAMAAVKPEIDELRKDIEHLEAIKGTMKSLNGVEMELTQGLTKEGFQVYRAIRDQLTNVDIDGGRTARAARLDAILFARHADIVADIISKKTGKKYTALDYMRERYGLIVGNGHVPEHTQSSVPFMQMVGQRAAVANLDDLKRAREMHSRDVDEQEIWRETGWLLGRDNKWRFEIPDDLDKIDFAPLFQDEYHIAKLKDIYNNPQLYKAYPALATRTVQLTNKLDDNTRGMLEFVKYPSGRVHVSEIKLNQKLVESTPDKIKETLVHEVQHAIQEYEDFARGGNIENSGGFNNYYRLGGEQEARETSERARSYTESKHHIDELSRQLDLKKKDLEHVLANASKEEKADYAAYDRAYQNADTDNAADDTMASIEKKNWKSIELWNDIYMLGWYIEDEKAITERMPKPHAYDAIITFGGQEMASIDLDQKTGHSGTHGSIAQMSNGQRIISLFESADESTFLHEMGHMFLMDLEDLAVIDDISAKELEVVKDWASWKKGDAKQYKNTPWEKEFRQREQQIIDAEEHQDIEEVEKLKRIWEQERFARAFEMYLHDGHAPAKGLKAVFRKFRSFLIHIYRAVIGDGAKPSLQVRRIMDRMIATEEEIDEMALDDRYRDVTKAGGEKLLDESEEETYKRWQEEATAEAKEQLQKRVMKDLTEEKEHEFQRRMQHERETFRKELQNENVYLAEQAVLASGGDTSIVLNWYPSVEAFEEELKNAPALDDLLKEHMDAYAQELDRELTESHLSEQAVTEAMESSEYRAKLEALKATAFAKKQALVKNITTKTERAMRSVEERIKDLPEDLDLKLDKDSSAVKELMKAINKLRFSAKWRPEDYQTIQRMIHAATKEDLQKTMQEIKEQARTDKANEKAVLDANEGKMKVYRELARRAILAKPIHESCSVSLYTREAKKWARTVQQAIRGKNWDSAMMAQQRQAYAMAMANEARQMQKRVQASLDRAKRMLQAKSIRLPREERYWLRHLAYLLRMTRTDAKLGEGEEMTDLHTMFNRLQESLDSQYTPEEIFKIEKQGEDFHGYQDLNVGQLEECVEALTILYTTGRDKFKMKTIGGRTIDEIVQEIISDNEADARKIGVNRHRVQEDTGGMGWNDALAKIPFVGEGLARYGQEGLAAIIKPEEILSALGKKAHRYIYGIYERAAEKESRMVKQELTDLQTILSGYSHSERRHWKDMKYTLRTADGKELMSKENVLCMALNLGNETNRQRLIGGLGISEVDAMQFVEEHMTAKDWQLVQDIWDHINVYWDDTVKVEENLNGVRLEKVEAKPFDVTITENGKKTTLKMKGGYYPLSYNPKKSSRAADQNANEIAKQGMSGAMVLGTGRGFTKARSEYDISRPLLLEFRVIPEHVQSVIHNIAFRLAARDVFRLVNHPDFEAHVANTLGREYHTILKQWTTDVWQVVKDNNNQAANMLERGLNWLRSNSIMAIMGYRIWPVVENVSNIAPVMEKLGSLHAMKAIMSFYANPKESTELLKRSAFMQDRINSLDRDIRSQPGLFEADHRVFELIRNHAYDMMLYSDLALSAPLWVQSYRDAYSDNLAAVRKENAEHQQSVLEAQQNVEKLKADIISQSQKVSDIRMDMERRHSADEQDRAAAQQSPFAVHSDATMEQITKEEAAKIKEIKKELFNAEQALHDAMDLPIYTDEEMLQEAERRSVMEADKTIRDTFGSGRTMDQSSLQRNKNAFLKLATTFYSFFNTQFNAILANYRHARFGTNPSFIGRWAPFAKSVMYRLVIMTLIGISIKFALGLDGDDDKDRFRTVINPQTGKSEKVEIPLGQRFFNTYAKNLLSTAAGGFPFIRDVVNFAISAIFDGTTYGRSASPFSVGGRAFEEVSKTIDLMAKKSSHNMAIDAQEAKRHQTEAEKLKKKKGKARREYLKKLEEDAKYRQPVKHITNSEIARHGLNALSSLTAARTGITSTMTDAITGTMQYLNDSDNRYDADWKNIIWSVVFDKKPVERDIPKRPPAEPKSKKKKKKS
ncbi:LPD23 domain-containing protein [Mitsuokella jalaludinii]|uniref:LPD23 domain-containing protein n=1 Tax=Mitsuokella jalaludinii TaxID=187979 RepID=UPI00307FA84D